MIQVSDYLIEAWIENIKHVFFVNFIVHLLGSCPIHGSIDSTPSGQSMVGGTEVIELFT